MPEPEFTPEEIALGEKVTAYYQQDSLPEPEDNETKTQPPFPLTSKEVGVDDQA